MLSKIIDYILFSVFSLDSGTKLAESLHFFIYDSVKIVLLLLVMIFVIGIIRSYVPDYKVRKFLSGKKSIFGNLIASIFGVLTPFCSCSSIPLFLSFLKARVPFGITLSFLITSPLVNEYLVVLMLGFFGWKITLAYVISGIIIGTFSGVILGKMKLEKYIEKDFLEKNYFDNKVNFTTFMSRIKFGINESVSITKKLWIWILVGVGVGAVIHNYIPKELIDSTMESTGIFAVPLAVIIGVPLYANCAAIVPVAVALFEKGVSLGTTLAFMMSSAAISLPEAIILRRAMKLKLIAIFFGVVTLGIIIIGYVFNLLFIFLQ